jgi:hypothetical protein
MKTYSETAVESFTGVAHKPRPNYRANKQYAAHVAAQGGPLAKPVDVTGTRRTRPTEPPRAIAAELADLRLQLHYAQRAHEATARSVRELEALIRSKGAR